MNMLSPHHFVLDGYGGYRSRYDDTSLIYELLDELPAALNLTPAMPPIVLPYYNGVTPDDCGISAFVILNGGHMTLHTFSFRECFFADILAPQAFDADAVEKICNRTLPATQVATQMIDRDSDDLDTNGRSEADFGPHLMMEVEGYCGPDSMDDLFALFDRLPDRIGMTPIMRPCILRSQLADGSTVISAITMIAESHIAIHVNKGARVAWFDLFSCSFFEPDQVVAKLQSCFPGDRHTTRLTIRGRRHRSGWTDRESANRRSKLWLDCRLPD